MQKEFMQRVQKLTDELMFLSVNGYLDKLRVLDIKNFDTIRRYLVDNKEDALDTILEKFKINE